jgi:hypothetical protein
MMEFIKRQLLDASRDLGVSLAELSPTESIDVRHSLAERFCVDGTPTVHWNHLRDYAAVQHPESWRWLNEFLGDERVFLVPEASDEPAVFVVESAARAYDLLGECSLFVFYLADQALTYLLCQNQHDFLFGAGTAKPWVESLRPRHEEWVAALPGKKET